MKQLLLTLRLLSVSNSALTLDEINSTYFGHLAIEGYDAIAYLPGSAQCKGART